MRVVLWRGVVCLFGVVVIDAYTLAAAWSIARASTRSAKNLIEPRGRVRASLLSEYFKSIESGNALSEETGSSTSTPAVEVPTKITGRRGAVALRILKIQTVRAGFWTNWHRQIENLKKPEIVSIMEEMAEVAPKVFSHAEGLPVVSKRPLDPSSEAEYNEQMGFLTGNPHHVVKYASEPPAEMGTTGVSGA